jgi:hypothetical protein
MNGLIALSLPFQLVFPFLLQFDMTFHFLREYQKKVFSWKNGAIAT